MDSTLTCPRCGSTVAADASWCGTCGLMREAPVVAPSGLPLLAKALIVAGAIVIAILAALVIFAIAIAIWTELQPSCSSDGGSCGAPSRPTTTGACPMRVATCGPGADVTVPVSNLDLRHRPGTPAGNASLVVPVSWSPALETRRSGGDQAGAALRLEASWPPPPRPSCIDHGADSLAFGGASWLAGQVGPSALSPSA